MFASVLDELASLSTDRVSELGSGPPYFGFELLFAGIAIGFCRSTVSSHKSEPRILAVFFGLALALMAYFRQPYFLTMGAEIFSYALPWFHFSFLKSKPINSFLTRFVFIALGAGLSLLLSWALFSPSTRFYSLSATLIPSVVKNGFAYLFPIIELGKAYEIVFRLSHDEITVSQMLQHLLFVTFHIQVGIGFLGIHFLQRQQGRKNELIRLDVSEEVSQKTTSIVERATEFKRGAAPFSKSDS